VPNLKELIKKTGTHCIVIKVGFTALDALARVSITLGTRTFLCCPAQSLYISSNANREGGSRVIPMSLSSREERKGGNIRRAGRDAVNLDLGQKRRGIWEIQQKTAKSKRNPHEGTWGVFDGTREGGRRGAGRKKGSWQGGRRARPPTIANTRTVKIRTRTSTRGTGKGIFSR